MSFDVIRIRRDGYTLIDMLSDIGGMESILISGISLFLSLWNYKHFDTYMASNLYKLVGDEKSSFFKLPKLVNIKLFCMDFLPQKLVCCRKT